VALLPLLSALSAPSGTFGSSLSGHGPPPPTVVPALPRTKTDPIASLPEACRVVMPSNTLVVLVAHGQAREPRCGTSCHPRMSR
jgi:hypothetical protein